LIFREHAGSGCELTDLDSERDLPKNSIIQHPTNGRFNSTKLILSLYKLKNEATT